MSKIGSMMDVGKRSMMNNQSSLQTVAHNIASKDIEGFSRQRTENVTNPPLSEGGLQIGMGARAAKVNRVNNPFVDRQLQVESGVLAYNQSQADALGRTEQVFNEQINKSLNSLMSNFYNAYRELANNPESTTTRTMVKEAAEAVAQDFNRIDSQLTKVQDGIDDQILSQVQQVNGFIGEIADLNKQISQIELQGSPANDQRDRRDVLVKKLNEMIDVKVAEGDRGAISISTAGNALLVSGFDATRLTTLQDPATRRLKVLFDPGTSQAAVDITPRIHAGAIGGALQIRDGVVNEMKAQMDQLAFSFSSKVNEIHMQGFDRFGRPAELFFEPQDSVAGSAKAMQLSDKIRNDVGRIASAAQPNSPGDNTVANMISQLQNREVMDRGTSTMDDFYKAQVGRIGVLAGKAIQAQSSQENIVKQVNNLRESISGVSLDEEATKMIEYQKAFEASARLIRTADEMLETVINLKRI